MRLDRLLTVDDFKRVAERRVPRMFIRECEDGRDITVLLKGPVAHSGFTRLN